MKILFKNATLVTPEKTWQADLLVDGEKIQAIAPGLQVPADQVIDATGKYILPGVIDAHTHMGIPILNTWSSDDFSAGTQAAACGGVTTIMDFTVQSKGQSLLAAVQERRQRAEHNVHVDYTLHCNITDFTANTLTAMQEVTDQGVSSFKVFTAYKRAGMMLHDDELLQVFARAAELQAVVMLHAENGDIIDFLTDKLIAAGKVSAPFHPVSRPVETEIEAVHRAIVLAQVTGVTLYIVHLTSAGALQLIRQAQERGLAIIAETCPQYLLFTRKVYEQPGGHCYIASPPFREQQDCASLWEGIANGGIAVVGTDHCPFTRAQKDSGQRQFHTTPNGLPGVETLLPLLYSEGVGKGRITLNQLVAVLSENPAKIFGLFPGKGRLQEGFDADLVVFDPKQEVTISASTLHSNTDWSPYEGWQVTGYPERTFVRGREIMRAGKLLQPAPTGRFVQAKRP